MKTQAAARLLLLIMHSKNTRLWRATIPLTDHGLGLVRSRLKMLGTVVLWIDEAHDLFRAGKAIEDILKVLKSVMQGDGAVILVLTGVDILWQMASYDDQVKRRFSKVTLPPISASTHEKSL